jgi:hypothetical protein
MGVAMWYISCDKGSPEEDWIRVMAVLMAIDCHRVCLVHNDDEGKTLGLILMGRPAPLIYIEGVVPPIKFYSCWFNRLRYH